jgi:hypothetical protein
MLIRTGLKISIRPDREKHWAIVKVILNLVLMLPS